MFKRLSTSAVFAVMLIGSIGRADVSYTCQLTSGETAKVENWGFPESHFDAATRTLLIHGEDKIPSVAGSENKYGFIDTFFFGPHAIGVAPEGKQSLLLVSNGAFVNLNCKKAK